MVALLPLITEVLVALISPVMLGGLVFSKIAATKIFKLNPLSGIAKMFSAQTGAETA